MSGGEQIHGTGSTHGTISLIEAACTSCMICARECPSWCITIDSHTEAIPDLPAGSRERTRNVLDRFAIDWALCMYCGICIDECPFDALTWEAALTPAGRHLIQEFTWAEPETPADRGVRTDRA